MDVLETIFVHHLSNCLADEENVGSPHEANHKSMCHPCSSLSKVVGDAHLVESPCTNNGRERCVF